MKKITIISTIFFIILLFTSCSLVVEDDSLVIAEFNTDNENDNYEIMLVQSKNMVPLTPEDEGFDIYKSMYYGEFELLLVKDKVVIDSLNLNDCFDRGTIGFIGKFTLFNDDFNDDGNMDFNIGIMNEGVFEYIVFTVKDNLFEVFTFDGNKTLKSASSHHSEEFKRGTEGEIIITLPKDTGGYYEKSYYWDRDQFLSK